jgi:hypothetical protein
VTIIAIMRLEGKKIGVRISAEVLHSVLTDSVAVTVLYPMESGCFSSGLKRRGREAACYSTFGVEFKNT